MSQWQFFGIGAALHISGLILMLCALCTGSRPSKEPAVSKSEPEYYRCVAPEAGDYEVKIWRDGSGIISFNRVR